ncbi:MAG: LL-diaminopimelate aminotransferase, partial [Acutalibacteraceae bacterium]|nr:LL-diaminopimelate aminotransferase [Acutalibacteraceae bacterium]
MQFSSRLNKFGDEIFAALDQLKERLINEGKTIYNLSIGTPDFEPPKHIIEALKTAADDPKNWKYSLHDLPELTQAVCEYYKRRFSVDINQNQVMSVYG